jgi:hypothetical protein
MRSSLTLTTVALALGLYVVGSLAAGPVAASPGGPPAVQARGKKKHHRPKSQRHARPKPAKSASSSKKNDRGFEL